MKLTRLSVTNVLGVSAIAIQPKQPIIVIAGDNGAGKSSLYQAMRLVLIDELPRIDLKRDASALVRGSAPRGAIEATLDGVDYAITLPARIRGESGLPEHTPAIGWCTDPGAFMRMEPGERANLIRRLSHVKMDPPAIASRLKAHGVPEFAIGELTPLLRLGFEKCADHARQQAAEARGAWKQVTGEVYGSRKAVGWKAPGLPALPTPPIGYEDAALKYQAAVALQAKLQTKRRTAIDQRTAMERDSALVGNLAAIESRIMNLRPTADAGEEVPTVTCPECGSILELKDGALAKHERPATPAVVKPATRAAAKRELAQKEREKAEALTAKARLQGYAPIDDATDEEFAQVDQQVAETMDVMSSIQRGQNAYDEAKRQHDSVALRESQAAGAHARVEGWETAANALSPAGIPSELMAQAMQPFRAEINAIASDGCIDTWPKPEVADDGGISAWGRPWYMLSDSEVYRVNVVLTLALAKFSGVKLIAMDGADILSPAARGELLGLLDNSVEAGDIEQAWVFLTLKAMPNVAAPIEAHWIANGTEGMEVAA